MREKVSQIGNSGLKRSKRIVSAVSDIHDVLSPNSKRLEWLILAWGILLRLVPYIAKRSLWLDESELALNVIHRSFAGLLKPLNYEQGAPVGFLILEKAAVRVLGSGEYGLRFVPLLCGVISLFIFYRLAKLSISPKAVPIALGLFALSGPLIYYSSEVKQYSGDVVVAVLLLYAAIYYESYRLNRWALAAFGVLGAASIWFSHPSVFVLVGVGLSLALFGCARSRWPGVRRLSVVFLLWALGFAACYVLSLRHLSNDKALLGYWSFAFPPSPLLSLTSVRWFLDTLFGVFRNPAGLGFSGLAALAFLVGCASMFSRNAEKALILGLPLFPTLIAAGLHKYPFNGRLILFLVPTLLLFVAEGAERIWSKTRDEAPIIGACLVGLLFLQPLLFSTYDLIKPRASDLPLGIVHGREEIRPVMKYLQDQQQEGDVLYVYNYAVPAFLYYAPRFSLNNLTLVTGSSGGWEGYQRDLNRLRGHRRVWFLFSHTRNGAGFDEEPFFLYLSDKSGTKLDSFQTAGAAGYLYDLAGTSNAVARNARQAQEPVR
ncbi:MAG: glycosyltransferase family 39 protein [Candidatus Acidiferrales bacterium]